MYICTVSPEGTVSDQCPACGIQTDPEPHWRVRRSPAQGDPEEPAQANPAHGAPFRLSWAQSESLHIVPSERQVSSLVKRPLLTFAQLFFSSGSCKGPVAKQQ